MYRHFAAQIEARSGFHVGGPPATIALARAGSAALSTPVGRILDLCSGIGPSVTLLRKFFGSSVVRLDLVIDQLVAGAGTDRVAAEAMSLPFRNACFDMVWSEDAFSHVPDRQLLLHECRRVLRPGGHLVFFDLVRALPVHDTAAFCDAWSLAPLETVESYRARLEREEYRVLSATSMGRQMVATHAALETSIGDAPVDEYERWLREERSLLLPLWGRIGLAYQRTRLLMYPWLEEGFVDYLHVVARRR